MYEGQMLYIKAQLIYPDEKPTTGVLVKVIASHGDHARVRHEKTGFEKLMPKWDLWIRDETDIDPIVVGSIWEMPKNDKDEHKSAGDTAHYFIAQW